MNFRHLLGCDTIAVNVILKKLSPEENFHSYQQIDGCETPKNL